MGSLPSREGTSVRAGEHGSSPASTAASASFLEPLTEEERQALLQACRPRRFQPGKLLFREGERGHSLYFLLNGHVKVVCAAADGGETLLYIYGPGECLGELAFIDDKPRSATGVALGTVEALALDREAFFTLLERYPRVALAVMHKATALVRRLHREVQALLSLDAAGRIAYKLLELAERHGEREAQGVRLGLRITQEELARMVGAARTTVNQQLRRLEKQGILTLNREQLLIHRLDRLRQRIY
jgi:CRP/FNR family transcriptional regulator/CRP/FNR family cyclic AMP-dependent transcriptional regulator